MSTPGWDTTLVSPALTLDGQTTQVLTGRTRLDSRQVTVLRLGDDGPTVILLPSAAGELIANLRTLAEGEPT